MSLLGTTVGRIRLVDILGRGGMGEVYLGFDEKLKRKVAIKALNPELRADPLWKRRFLEEARILSSLAHPGICQIHDLIETDESDFLVLELVEGDTLHNLVPADGMTLARFLQLAIPMTEALAAAHQAKVVHRDLKPSNVMVSEAGQVKLLDFGIARSSRASDGAAAQSEIELSKPGEFKGTVPYMSPEQLHGLRVDQRSDIFSLGVVFFEMLTARRPFDGDTSAAMMLAILQDPPHSLGRFRADLPSELDGLISRCLEKSPDERCSEATDIARQLNGIEGDEGHESQRPKSEEPAAQTQVLDPSSKLSILRTELLSAATAADLNRLRHEIEVFVNETPNEVEGLVLRDQIQLALDEQRAAAAPLGRASMQGHAPARWSSASRLSWVGALGFLLIVGIGFGTWRFLGSEVATDSAAMMPASPSAEDGVSAEPSEPGSVPDPAPAAAATRPPPVPTADDRIWKGVSRRGPAEAVLVRLSSDPDGSRVFVDGEEVGVTPSSLELIVGSTHRFRFEWPDGTASPIESITIEGAEVSIVGSPDRIDLRTPDPPDNGDGD